jgi:membrane-associated phospholipid phosphatase
MLRKAFKRYAPQDPWWHVWGLMSGLIFALLVAIARLYPQFFEHIDTYVDAAVVPFQAGDVATFFLILTTFGGGIGVSLLALIVAYFLRRHPFYLLQLGLLLLYVSVSMGIAKSFVERARPEALFWVDPLNSFSFPSGHAALSTAFYGFLAVYLYRTVRSRSYRLLAVGSCVLLAALISLSRLVLNVHYFTDIIAGALLGLFWLSVVFMLPSLRK